MNWILILVYCIIAAIQSKLFIDALIDDGNGNLATYPKIGYVLGFIFAPLVTIALVLDFFFDPSFRKDVIDWTLSRK